MLAHSSNEGSKTVRRQPIQAARLLSIAAIAALCACSSAPETHSSDSSPIAAVPDTAPTQPPTTGMGGNADLASSHTGMSDRESIYFAFDSWLITSGNEAVVKQDAGYLRAHPGMNVELQGNTDERGSREYNLALGDRRAQSVKRQLVLLGLPADRLEPVSFGKEKPKALEHDEAAWSQNRRVDLSDDVAAK